jgi:hypothetical protein
VKNIRARDSLNISVLYRLDFKYGLVCIIRQRLSKVITMNIGTNSSLTYQQPRTKVTRFRMNTKGTSLLRHLVKSIFAYIAPTLSLYFSILFAGPPRQGKYMKSINIMRKITSVTIKNQAKDALQISNLLLGATKCGVALKIETKISSVAS